MLENEILILGHGAATWALVGLIWFVQIVHYPLFARVGVEGFAGYERSHARRTSRVVVPLMMCELITALLLLWRVGTTPTVIGAVLLALVWVSTFLLQVPHHRKLANGFDVRAHRWLVATNWIRTLAWSARGVIAVWILRGG